MTTRIPRISLLTTLISLSIGCSDAERGGETNDGSDGDSTAAGGTGGDLTAGSGGHATGGAAPSGGAGLDSGGSGGVPVASGGSLATGGSGGLQTPQPGKVGVFVAAGHGARTLTSCDDGRTWIANDQREDENVDHSPFTDKGLTYGDGQFVQAVGWGNPNSVKVSENGVDWSLVLVDGGGAGVTYLETPSARFVTYNGWGSCMESSDASSWAGCSDDSRHNYRQNIRDVGGSGAFVGIGGDAVDLRNDQNQVYATNVGALFSFDGGTTWQHSDACDMVGGFGNLGQTGGFANGNGVAVAVSQHGPWCSTTDEGETWASGDLDGANNERGIEGKLKFLDGRFWAAAGDRGYRSSDGATWEELEFKPDGVIIHDIAWSEQTGSFVGVERIREEQDPSHLYWSTDGVTWNLVVAPPGPTLRRVAFGFVDASDECPSDN